MSLGKDMSKGTWLVDSCCACDCLACLRRSVFPKEVCFSQGTLEIVMIPQTTAPKKGAGERTGQMASKGRV